MNEPIHITDAKFDELANGPVPVIFDFWAPWCGPCKMLMPHLETIAKEYADKLIIAKINVDENTEKAAAFSVAAIPTLLFYKDGKLVHRNTGSLGYPQLKSMVDEFLA